MASTGQEPRAPSARDGFRDGLGELLGHLHALSGSATRNELTERLGCGRSVMGFLLGELSERGVIEVDRSVRRGGPQARGRPSHLIKVSPTAPAALAVHLDVDFASVAIVGLGGQVLRQSDTNWDGPADAGAVLDLVARLVRRHARARLRLVGVGVAVPSAVRRDDGLAVAPLHVGWPAVPLRALLLERLRLDYLPVFVGNDANLAGLAEHIHGAGRGALQMLYLTTARVGLGGALVSNGRLFDGAHGYAIEPGHITVDPAGARCACGSTGCLEVEADHRGLLAAAGMSEDDLHDIAGAAIRLLDAATANGGEALAAVETVAAKLGNGLASLTNLTDPDRVVLGGSLARYYELAPGVVEANLMARSFLAHDRPVPIFLAALPNAALIGAADLAFQQLLNDPRAVLGPSA